MYEFLRRTTFLLRLPEFVLQKYSFGKQILLENISLKMRDVGMEGN